MSIDTAAATARRPISSSDNVYKPLNSFENWPADALPNLTIDYGNCTVSLESDGLVAVPNSNWTKFSNADSRDTDPANPGVGAYERVLTGCDPFAGIDPGELAGYDGIAFYLELYAPVSSATTGSVTFEDKTNPSAVKVWAWDIPITASGWIYLPFASASSQSYTAVDSVTDLPSMLVVQVSAESGTNPTMKFSRMGLYNQYLTTYTDVNSFEDWPTDAGPGLTADYNNCTHTITVNGLVITDTDYWSQVSNADGADMNPDGTGQYLRVLDGCNPFEALSPGDLAAYEGIAMHLRTYPSVAAAMTMSVTFDDITNPADKKRFYWNVPVTGNQTFHLAFVDAQGGGLAPADPATDLPTMLSLSITGAEGTANPEMVFSALSLYGGRYDMTTIDGLAGVLTEASEVDRALYSTDSLAALDAAVTAAESVTGNDDPNLLAAAAGLAGALDALVEKHTYITLGANGDGSYIAQVTDGAAGDTYQLWSYETVDAGAPQWILRQDFAAIQTVTFTPVVDTGHFHTLLKTRTVDGTATSIKQRFAFAQAGQALIRAIRINGIDASRRFSVPTGTKLSVEIDAAGDAAAYTGSIQSLRYSTSAFTVYTTGWKAGQYELVCTAAGTDAVEDTFTVSLELCAAPDTRTQFLEMAPLSITGTAVSIQQTRGGGAVYRFAWGEAGRSLTTTEWGASAQWTLPAEPGVYAIEGQIARPDMESYDDFAETEVAVPRTAGSVSIDSFTASADSVETGTELQFTAAAVSDGAGVLQYAFWLFEARGAVLLQDWSSASALAWTPQRIGRYTVQLRVRGDGAGSYEASAERYVTATAGGESTADGVVITLTGTEDLETMKRSVLTIVNTGTPRNDLLYRVDVVDANGKKLLREYCPDESFSWIPPKTGDFTLRLSVRSAASLGIYDQTTDIAVTAAVTNALFMSNYATYVEPIFHTTSDIVADAFDNFISATATRLYDGAPPVTLTALNSFENWPLDAGPNLTSDYNNCTRYNTVNGLQVTDNDYWTQFSNANGADMNPDGTGQYVRILDGCDPFVNLSAGDLSRYDGMVCFVQVTPPASQPLSAAVSFDDKTDPANVKRLQWTVPIQTSNWVILPFASAEAGGATLADLTTDLPSMFQFSIAGPEGTVNPTLYFYNLKLFQYAQPGQMDTGLENDYRFISVNCSNLIYVTDDTSLLPSAESRRGSSQFEITDSLETVKEIGGRVTRVQTLAIVKHDYLAGSPAHYCVGGLYDELLFRDFDWALAECNRLGLRMVMPVINPWSFIGGGKDFDRLCGGPGTMESFYNRSETIAEYKNVLSYLLNRVNVYTGVAYKDDKALLCWELGNEITAPNPTDDEGQPFYPAPAAWMTDIAQTIKSIDSNHLILDGGTNPSVMLTDEVRNSPYIDILDSHYSDPTYYCSAKPSIHGEFDPDYIDQAFIDNVMAAKSGMMAWTLEPHNKYGGFQYRLQSWVPPQPPLRWPGFADGMPDEEAKFALLRQNAYEVQGLTPPAVSVPAAPLLMPIKSLTQIIWRGSVGTASYELQRADTPDGVFARVAQGIGDHTIPRFTGYYDVVADASRTYYYRVVASNVSGASDPSNVMPYMPQGLYRNLDEQVYGTKQFIDELTSTELMLSIRGSIGVLNGVTDDRDKLFFRSAVQIVYLVDAPIREFFLTLQWMDTLDGVTVSLSEDGFAYVDATPTTLNYGVNTGTYRGRLENRAVTGSYRYLRIEVSEEAAANRLMLGRVEINM